MKKIIALLLVTLLSLSTPLLAERITLVDGNNNEIGTAGNPIKVSGGGSVSDDAYGAGWNGSTGTAPSQNAVYDKVETIVAGGLDFALDSSSSGNIVYVGCSDSIATEVAEATAGDTLILGSCTYAPGATITIDKALNIIGQGPYVTKITAVEDLFVVTADSVRFKNFSIHYSGTGNLGELIYFNCSAGTVCNNEVVDNVHWDTVTTNDEGGHLRFQDAGGVVLNVHGKSEVDNDGASQLYNGIFKFVQASAEADTYLYVHNSSFKNRNLGTGHTSQYRGIMNWNNGADESTQNTYLYLYDVNVLLETDSAAADSEAFQSQGSRVHSYVFGGYFDSTNTAASLTAGGGLPAEVRCAADANCYFYGTRFGRGLDEFDDTVFKRGYIWAQAMLGDAPPQAPHSLNGVHMLSLIGSQGGNKPGTGSEAGLIGGGVVLTGGAGGSATEATVTGTGGAGAPFTFTTGAGGAQTTATSTTNVGGAGGNLQIIGGAGGVANSASTTNTGGAGADIYIRGGLGGVGTTTTGTAGDVLLGIDSGGTLGGNVGIGTLAPAAMLDISKIGGSTATNHGTLNLSRNDTSVSSGDVIGQIQFWGNDTSMTTQNSFGTIDVTATATITTDQALGAMRFKFPITASAQPIEVLRISPTGLVVDETSQGLAVPFRVEGDNDANLIYTDGVTNTVAIGSSTATAGKFIVAPPSSQTIAATNTITANGCGTIKQITSAGAVTTNTTDTFTAPAAANTGCIMTVINVGANNITLDNNALFKSAGGADVVMTPDDSVVVASNGTLWYQVTPLQAN